MFTPAFTPSQRSGISLEIPSSGPPNPIPTSTTPTSALAVFSPTSSFSSSPSLDRARGMLCGVALGDALGGPHEFKRSLPLSTYTGRLTHPTKLFSQFQGTRYLVAGQVTDDTEMTLALLNSMVQQRRYDRDSVVLAYLKWANSGNVAMGTNTRDLMKGVTTLRGYNSRYTKSLNGTSKFMQNSEHYTTLMDVQSNGTLMRCSPLALLPEAERVNAIIHDVDITNPNPVNRECSTIYLFALSQLLRIGEEQDSLTTLVETYERCVARATQLPILNVFLEINSGSPRDVTQSKGWVVHAFYAAMHSLRLIIDGVVSSYSEAINMIVMLGGDTDTNAAIAGALIGAYYGYTKMYCEETTNYNLCVLMGADTSQGDFPRPELYSPRGIDVALKAWIEQRH